jgi:hypothetical protein
LLPRFFFFFPFSTKEIVIDSLGIALLFPRFLYYSPISTSTRLSIRFHISQQRSRTRATPPLLVLPI